MTTFADQQQRIRQGWAGVAIDPPPLPSTADIPTQEPAPTFHVQWFGAVGDGVNDDTAAINAALAFVDQLPRWCLDFGTGDYLTSGPLTRITGSNWTVKGDSRETCRVKGTADGPIFRIDTRSSSSFFGRITDMAIEGPTAGPATSSVAILVEADPASATGLNLSSFANLQFRDVYRGIYFEETQTQSSGSFTGISCHLQIDFVDLLAPVASGTNPIFEMVASEAAFPGICAFIGGHYRGSNAAIRCGSGIAEAAVGDILFSGVHIVIAGVGIDLVGPTSATCYNQNVTIDGCQIDNCTTATIRGDRMKNVKIGANNYTASTDPLFTNSSDIEVSPFTLRASGVAVTAPADTNENILATITVPPNKIWPNGTIRVWMVFSMTNNANVKTGRVRFSGIGGTIFRSVTLTSLLSFTALCEFQNRNSITSQIGGAATVDLAGSGGGVVTAAVNTGAEQTIVITGQKATAGDTLTLERYKVECFPAV